MLLDYEEYGDFDAPAPIAPQIPDLSHGDYDDFAQPMGDDPYFSWLGPGAPQDDNPIDSWMGNVPESQNQPRPWYMHGRRHRGAVSAANCVLSMVRGGNRNRAG